jgi:hypothetical protein
VVQAHLQFLLKVVEVVVFLMTKVKMVVMVVEGDEIILDQQQLIEVLPAVENEVVLFGVKMVVQVLQQIHLNPPEILAQVVAVVPMALEVMVRGILKMLRMKGVGGEVMEYL